MRYIRIALIVVAVVCFGIALSYPIRYHLAQKSNDSELEELSAMRARAREEAEAAGEAAPLTQDASTDDGQVAVPARTEAGTTAAQPGDEVVEVPGDAPQVPATVGDGAGAPGNDPQPATDGGQPVAPDEGQGAVTGEGPGPATDGGRPAAPDEGQRAVTGEEPDPATDGGQTVATDDGRQAAAQAPADASEAALGQSQSGPAAADGTGEGDGVALTPGQARLLSEGGADDARPDDGTLEKPGDGETLEKPAGGGEAESEKPTPEPTPTPTPGLMDLILDFEPQPTLVPVSFATPSGPTHTPTPRPTFDVEGYTGALPYSLKEKVVLDEAAILPELREIYALNHDLVGWITIPDTIIDYPVVQTKDSDFYLTHDFYGRENQNGQIILDTLCDPYTPSYNLVISGHHMKNGSMFGNLPEYRTRSYWEKHRFVEFDTLMARKRYVVLAAFYSADYDENEKGFRYNVNVRYKMDFEPWMEEIRQNQLYDTEIDAVFGDEFITLTTCNRARHRNGRFVVVCRKIREGEIFE